MTIASLTQHPVVDHAQWVRQRTALMAREKELMRLHDQLAAERRALPWERMDKHYSFDTPAGRRTLADLFEGRRQLIVQHFMLGPGWVQGCPSCSYMADHTDGMRPHLAARGISFAAVSRAPMEEIARFKERMGWQFNWVSSSGTDFNHDFHVSFTPGERATGEVYYNFHKISFAPEEMPGISVFYKDDAGGIFHTYSTYGRGVEVMMGTYPMIDLTPVGRNEPDVPDKMEWVRHHDRYETEPATAVAAPPAGACCAHA